MGAKFSHLTIQDRKFIEKMLKNKVSVTVIADTLGVARSTVYREIKKGAYTHTYGYYRFFKGYSCDLGNKVYIDNRKRCQNPCKARGKYLIELENYLLKGYSPEMALKSCKYPDIVCTKTLYNYIDKCKFKKYRNIDLINGKQPIRIYKDRTHKSDISKNNSIDLRHINVLNRLDFGHWEMDTVEGIKKSNNSCLLVLTERKTRYELIFKINSKSSFEVVRSLRSLQRFYGSDYSKIFKTITIDNGTEFSNLQGMKRFSSTKFYYCHPYSSLERGSNENRNKLIRRFIPKGKDIQKYSTDYIKSVENFINNYPMRIHDYDNPLNLYKLDLQKLCISTNCCI